MFKREGNDKSHSSEQKDEVTKKSKAEPHLFRRKFFIITLCIYPLPPPAQKCVYAPSSAVGVLQITSKKENISKV